MAEPTGKFSLTDSKRIAAAVKTVEGQARDGATARRSNATTDNRVFWISYGVGGSDVPGNTPVEVVPQEQYSGSTPTGQIKYVQINNDSGRAQNVSANGSATTLSKMFGAGIAGGYNNAQLVVQSFDTSQDPPVSIVRQASPMVVVDRVFDSGTAGFYDGAIGGDSATATCKVFNLNGGADQTTAGNISSYQTPDQVTSGGTITGNHEHFGLGMIIGQTDSAPFVPLVAMSLEYQSKVVWVKLTVDSGSNGTNPSFSGGVYTAATAPTYTYTATTTSGPSATGNDYGGGKVLGTGLTPLKRRPGVSANAGYGIGWITERNFVLFDAGE